MYDVEIYADKNGYSETAEWIRELDKKAESNKDCRVRLKKLYEYIEILKSFGTRVGAPVVKHLTGTEFWELRPTRDRVIFIYAKDNKFLLLNHFVKKTEKTPARELEKARRMLKDYIERSGGNG